MPQKGMTWRKKVFQDVYNLTDQEKVSLGLKKPAPLRDLVHIVIPVHHSSHGVIWESRFVAVAAVPSWRSQYLEMEEVENEW